MTAAENSQTRPPLRKRLFRKKPHRRYGEREDRIRRRFGIAFSILALILGIYYLIWHYHFINWSCWYVSVPFFICECVGFLLFAFFFSTTCFPRHHDPTGIKSDRIFNVDVFITTCGEPLEILRQTLQGAVDITYEPKTVYILDDKANPKVAALANGYGVRYLARGQHLDSKAGNLNYGLAHSQGDLILTLDADQVPYPEILSRLVGYFNISSIGFVQSKQNFLIPPGDPFGNADKVFYNVMQCGKDWDNAAFSCGSGVVYRRRALEEVGGFSTWNIVEDVHTSMLLHQRGWRSVYHDYPLSIGTTPTDIWGVYRQRGQWAADSLRLLFWDNPFWRRGLTLKQKMQYFNLGFVYLVSAFFMPLFFIVPIWAIFTSQFVLTASVPDYLSHRLPFFIAMSVGYAVLNYPTPYLHAYQMWTGLFPSFLNATFVALSHRRIKPAYLVTSKKEVMELPRPAVVAVLPQLLIILGALAAIIYGLFIHSRPLDFILLNCAWATWSIWTMSAIVMAALFRSPREVPEIPWFTPQQIIANVLAMALFLFLFLLAAVLIMQFSRG